MITDYKLSDSVDKEKLFMVKYSEIEGRLDPKFYGHEFNKYLKQINKKGAIRTKEVFHSINNGFDCRDYVADGTPYLKVANVKKGELKTDKLQFLKINNKDLSKNIQLKKGNLLVTRKGTFGNVVLLKKNLDYIISSEIFYIELKPNTINAKYLEIYFNSRIGQLQFDKHKIGAIMGSLSQSVMRFLKIPVPPKKIQQQIVDVYEKAYEAKQQKEAEAKTLLASIDDYLLNELGIELPKKDNSLSNRIFTTKFTELTENRFDPFYFLNCIKSKHSSIYKEYSLKELAYINKGQSITSSKIVKGEYPVIAGGQTSPYSHNEYNYFKNIITVSASGAYAGYVWYHDYPIFASDCNVIKSKNENKCLTIFLYNILKVKQTELYNFQQGSGQPHVYAKDIKKISIPLPPPDKQREIVSHIKQIREKAKKLENEAKEVLESTKKVVEKMILGE